MRCAPGAVRHRFGHLTATNCPDSFRSVGTDLANKKAALVGQSKAAFLHCSFGGPADSVSPVALLPIFADGLPLSGTFRFVLGIYRVVNPHVLVYSQTTAGVYHIHDSLSILFDRKYMVCLPSIPFTDCVCNRSVIPLKRFGTRNVAAR